MFIKKGTAAVRHLGELSKFKTEKNSLFYPRGHRPRTIVVLLGSANSSVIQGMNKLSYQ